MSAVAAENVQLLFFVRDKSTNKETPRDQENITEKDLKVK